MYKYLDKTTLLVKLVLHLAPLSNLNDLHKYYNQSNEIIRN